MSRLRSPATQIARRRSTRPRINRPRPKRRVPKARAANHRPGMAPSVARVARQPLCPCRCNKTASFAERLLMYAKTFPTNRRIAEAGRKPDLRAWPRDAARERPGSEGRSGGPLRPSGPGCWSRTSSHHGTVSSSQRDLDPSTSVVVSASAGTERRGLRAPSCVSGSAMRSRDAAGHTVSIAESGNTRERRPLSRRNVPSRPGSNRLTRPRGRPSARIA
jgi:hypothetical protein